jgi:hypothetical protein
LIPASDVMAHPAAVAADSITWTRRVEVQPGVRGVMAGIAYPPGDLVINTAVAAVVVLMRQALMGPTAEKAEMAEVEPPVQSPAQPLTTRGAVEEERVVALSGALVVRAEVVRVTGDTALVLQEPMVQVAEVVVATLPLAATAAMVWSSSATRTTTAPIFQTHG